METTTATLDRAGIARQAFWGGLPALADYVQEAHGYTDLDGTHYPANGATLAEYIAWVAELPAEVLAIFVAADPELAGLLASEAAHKAAAVAGQEWLNHRWGSAEPAYKAALYHAQDLETQIHRAYVAVCMPL